MKVFVCAALILMAASPAWTATDASRQCLLKATEALPKKPGLQVKKSGIRPMPSEQLANWKGQSKPIIVDLDTDTPIHGRERYSYLCARTTTGSVFVQRRLE